MKSQTEAGDGDLLQQLRGGVDVAGDAYGVVVDRVHEFHRAIADQPFAVLKQIPLLATGSQPVRVLHDGITDGVYRSVGMIGAAVFSGTSALLRESARHWRTPAIADARLDAGVSALGGAVGDHLARRRNPLTPQLGLYHAGQRVACTPAALAQQFPDAQPQLVVFVHGLCCNEQSWQLYRDAAWPETFTYGERLQAHGYSALYLRYNTGLHISQNGRRLARLLRQLVANWPVPATRLVLIGHSMGGLVCRAAAASTQAADQDWISRLSELICLGSPHRGAPLEQAVDAATGVMQQFALSRPLARVLDARSVGIRDLRYGATSDTDWRKGRARQWTPAAAIARAPQARYHFIGSSLGRDAQDWLGKTFGDGLVRLDSSLAEAFNADTVALFGKHHMQLLNDTEVYALIAEKLGLVASRRSGGG